MEPFTITFGRQWWSRIVGRNPLVRHTDRVQAWAFVLAAAIALLAIPVTGAIGTSVYDDQVQFYAQEAKHRRSVTATALENSTVNLGPGPADVSFFVRASWTYAGSDHVEVVEWVDEAAVGDHADIWVDAVTGEPADPPSPRSAAVSDALGVAFSVWFAVTATAIGGAYVIREYLAHRRCIQWDRELQSLHYQS